MQIACPACDTRYDVPDARLAPGRRVKCTRCGDGWIPIPPVVELLQPDPPPPPKPPEAAVPPPRVFSAPRAEPAPTTPPKPDRLLRVGWLATAILLVAAVLLARTYRTPIEHAWPPSLRLYSLF